MKPDRIYRRQDAEHLKLIAHRGFAQNAPQNSLAAFQAAGERRFWAVETDVRFTKDGVPVCSHNETIDGVFNGAGPVSGYTWEELSRLRFLAAPEARIPLFEEYLGICRRYGALPFIETKTPDVEAVLRTALRFFPEEDIILSSIRFEHLLLARKASGRVFLHHIFSTPEQMEQLARLGRCGVSYNYTDLSSVPEGLLEETHRRGALACLRAGDTPEVLREMLRLGLDYIPTNKMTESG